jgi:hypothetical protein
MENRCCWQFYVSVFLSISSVGVFLLFYLSVLLAVLCVSVSLHFICWCFSPILSIGVAGSFMEKNTNRWNEEKHQHINLPATPIDKIGEKHRQMKWRETPLILSIGVAGSFMFRCFSPFHLLVFLFISSVGVSLHFICWCFSPFHLSVFLSITDR